MEYHQCNESDKQKIGRAGPGKKFSFRTEFCEFREKGILKIGFFHGVIELSKSNETRYVVSPV